MSRTASSGDPCYAAAVRLSKEHPTWKLPAAMYLARFSEEECGDRVIQMRVRRLENNDSSSAPNTIVKHLSSVGGLEETPLSDVSSLTLSAVGEGGTKNSPSSFNASELQVLFHLQNRLRCKQQHRGSSR